MTLPLEDLIFTQQHDFEDVFWHFPQLSPMIVTPQDPFFHPEGNVYIHTKMVCKSLVSLEEYHQQDKETQYVLFLAALFHDVGKIYNTKTEPNGWISSKGHSRKGATEARKILWQYQVPFPLRERICRLISAHQVIFHLFEKDSLTIDFTMRKLSWEVELNLLAILAKADIMGRGLVCQESLNNIELFIELAKELKCYTSPYDFPSDEIRMDYFYSKGKTSPDFLCKQKEGSQAILLCGLPAAGKDTYANSLNLPVLSYDAARESLGLKHGSESGAATQLVLSQCKGHLRKKESFVMNATHLSKEMRSKALSLFEAYNAAVEIVYLEIDCQTLKTRNSKRDTIPWSAIEKLMNKWEIPLPSEAHRVKYIINGELLIDFSVS